MTTNYNLPAPVRIGVLKSTPAVFKTRDGVETSSRGQFYGDDGYQLNTVVSEAIHNQWTDTGTVALLLGFHTETCEEGCTSVVGLVELPSGQFETFSASCLKLAEATKY